MTDTHTHTHTIATAIARVASHRDNSRVYRDEAAELCRRATELRRKADGEDAAAEHIEAAVVRSLAKHEPIHVVIYAVGKPWQVINGRLRRLTIGDGMRTVEMAAEVDPEPEVDEPCLRRAVAVIDYLEVMTAGFSGRPVDEDTAERMGTGLATSTSDDTARVPHDGDLTC